MSNMLPQISTTAPSPDTSDSVSDTNEVNEVFETTMTPTEAFYQTKNNIKYLTVLCEGLKDDNDDDIFNINQAPFSSLKRGDIKPTADMLKQEIERRHQLAIPGPSAAQRPKPKHWGIETLRKWLECLCTE
jgi:hypothetical protein